MEGLLVDFAVLGEREGVEEVVRGRLGVVGEEAIRSLVDGGDVTGLGLEEGVELAVDEEDDGFGDV